MSLLCLHYLVDALPASAFRSGPFPTKIIKVSKCKSTLPIDKNPSVFFDVELYNSSLKNNLLRGNVTILADSKNNKINAKGFFWELGRWKLIYMINNMGCNSIFMPTITFFLGVKYDQKNCMVFKGQYLFEGVDVNKIQHLLGSVQDYGRIKWSHEFFSEAGSVFCWEIRALSSLLALMLAAQSTAQTTLVSDFVSPCPNVFSYDPLATETNRWFGTVNLTTDTPLYALWLNIVLENKANILGNWLGEVTTSDNIDFKIENTNVMITPDKPQPVRFFVQYNETLTPPKLKAIRFNGKEICQVKSQVVESEVPVRVAVGYEEVRPEVTTSTTASPTVTTTLSDPYWYQTEKPQTTTTTTTLKPQYWMETQTTESTSRTQQMQFWQRPIPNLKPNQTPNWFYTQADNNQQVMSTVKPTNQIRTGHTSRITTENNSVPGQVQSWSYSQTTDRNRTATPVWLNVASNENVSSKATRPNNFQIEVKQVGNTKYWSKIPENTTGATVMAPSGPESMSYGGSGNEQKVPDSGLQNQPYANISTNQAESTQNINQPRDRSPNVRPQNSYQPWVEPARNGMVIQSGVDTSRYPTNDGRIKSIDGSNLSFDRFQTTSEVPVPVLNKNKEDNSKQAEYYRGGLPVFYIPNIGPQNIAEPTCGKVLLNKGIAQNFQSTRTVEGQWPWLTALYQQQNSVELHYKYVCGGTLVSRRHLITAAHCVARQSSARPVNMDTLLVFMGKHNLRTTVEGIDLKFVYRILIHPDYDPTIYRTDLAILTLREPVTFTNKIQPICLWPEQETDLQNVVGETGSTVGWGYEITGVPREDQTLLQMEVISQQTCLIHYGDFFSRIDSEKTFCAAYRNSGMTCNGDSGGGMVFQKGDNWYLRGVVSLSVARQGTYHCDANNHVIFTDVAKFLPWIQDNIEDRI